MSIVAAVPSTLGRLDQRPVPLERLSTTVKIPLPLGASWKHDRPSPLPSTDGESMSPVGSSSQA